MQHSIRLSLAAVGLALSTQWVMSATALVSEDFRVRASNGEPRAQVGNDAVFGASVSTMDAGPAVGEAADQGEILLVSQSARWTWREYYIAPAGTFVFTSDPSEAAVVQDHHSEQPETEQQYDVSQGRFVEGHSSDASDVEDVSVTADFTIWEGGTAASSFLAAVDSVMSPAPFNFTVGGWHQVNLAFTGPSGLGSGTVPVAFMMGL